MAARFSSAALSSSELSRVLALLEVCERSLTLERFRFDVLEGLARHFSYRCCNFLLTEPLRSGMWPQDGVGLILPEGSMAAYTTDLGQRDVLLNRVTVARLRAQGTVMLSEELRSLAYRGYPVHQDLYVRQFLQRHRVGELLSLWLPTGVHRDGLVTLIASEAGAFGDRHRAVLLTLRPHLTNLLRRHLLTPQRPVAIDGLSARERDLARLVAAGLSNREIATALSVREDTVKKYVSRLLAKLALGNRTQLAVAWHDPPS